MEARSRAAGKSPLLNVWFPQCWTGGRLEVISSATKTTDISVSGRNQMWIMTNDSYLSIVSKDCGPAELLVRARRAGDIEKVFPEAKVTRNTNSDYLYRAVLPRDVVKQALAAMIDHIDYPNFKDSVEDRSLHAAYVGVWCAMAGLQHPPPDIERATHARSALTSKNTL
jgi:hypothetical protein